MNGVNNINRFPRPGGKLKGQNLQTIKDLLNSEDTMEDEIDYDNKSEDDDDHVLSKENKVEMPMLLDDSSLNSSEVGQEIVQNLVKLIKLKNKNW